MRTTIDVDPDVLSAARELARRQQRSLGQVLSDLARKGLTGSAHSPAADAMTGFYGFEPFPPRGRVVDNETVDRLRDEEGV